MQTPRDISTGTTLGVCALVLGLTLAVTTPASADGAYQYQLRRYGYNPSLHHGYGRDYYGYGNRNYNGISGSLHNGYRGRRLYAPVDPSTDRFGTTRNRNAKRYEKPPRTGRAVPYSTYKQSLE